MYHQDFRRCVSVKKTCLLFNSPGVLPFQGIEIGVSRSNWDSYGCFFALDGSQVAKAVFATVAARVVLQTNTSVEWWI